MTDESNDEVQPRLNNNPLKILPKPVGVMWMRQTWETDRAYGAFRQYLELGHIRTLREATKRYYGSKDGEGKYRQVLKWSSENHWGERAAVYDVEIDRQRMVTQAIEAQKMYERQAKSAMLMQAKGLARLGNAQPDELSISDCRYLIVEGAKLERTARGLDDYKVAIEHGGSVEHIGTTTVTVEWLEDLPEFEPVLVACAPSKDSKKGGVIPDGVE